MIIFINDLGHILKQQIENGQEQHNAYKFARAGALFDILNITITDPRSRICSYVEQTCCIVSLLWLATLHTSPATDASPTTFTSTARLLARTEPDWRSSLKILLWVLLRGTGSGVEDPKRMWDLAALKEATKSWPLVCNMQLHRILLCTVFESEVEDLMRA